MAQWENLKVANLIPTSEDKRTIHPAEPMIPEAADETGLIQERSNPLELNENAAPIPDAKTTPEAPATKDCRNTNEEGRGAGRVEPQTVAPEKDPVQIGREIAPKREQPSFLGNFEVVQESFLRDKPGSNSAVTTLPPGTRIRVEGKEGDYLRVRSLNDPGLRGYVHREDAFFERVR